MSDKALMNGGGESSDRIAPAKSANKGWELSAEQVEAGDSQAWAGAGHSAREPRCTTMPREHVQSVKVGRAYLRGGNRVR